MINSLRLVDFKNFADETLKVGPFTVIVGANASGKSNIRDAFRFLHGIGRGYTLAENLGGKYGVGGQLEWAGIRGAMNEIIRFGRKAFSLTVCIGNLRYSIEASDDKVRPGIFRVTRESLRASDKPIFRSHPIKGSRLSAQGYDTHLIIGNTKRDAQGRMPAISVRGDQPALTQLDEHEEIPIEFRNLAGRVVQSLAEMRFLDPVPDRMREPAFVGGKLSDYGENLAVALESIHANPHDRNVLLSWMQELTPMEVSKFEFPRDPSGRAHLRIVERNGRKVSGYSASDGTLRFLAILATLLGPKPASLYFFEEVDSGIHPNRLWLLLELMEKQISKAGVQIITTAHSPALLSWIREEAFENTSTVYRDEYWSDSVIRPIADLYDLRELRKSRTLGELHTEGWLETAMKFNEGAANSERLDEEHNQTEEIGK